MSPGSLVGLSRPCQEVWILAALLHGDFAPVLSPAILDEFRRAARYSKVRRNIGLTDRELRDLERKLTAASCWVEPESSGSVLISADPSDDCYLLAAAESEANYIVSGDRHLSALKAYEAIPILAPREFLGKIA